MGRVLQARAKRSGEKMSEIKVTGFLLQERVGFVNKDRNVEVEPQVVKAGESHVFDVENLKIEVTNKG